MSKQTFIEAKEKYFKTLELYVPVVARVHGENHPEFHEVRKLYDTIVKKIEYADSEQPSLEDEFTKLRKITNNYTVPGDVCETFEAVYNMLEELDKAYYF